MPERMASKITCDCLAGRTQTLLPIWLALASWLVAPEFATGRSDNSKSAPASLPEIRDTIDWTKVSLPEGSAPGRKGLSSYALEAPGTFAEAAAFFRKTLPELGWREDPNPVPGIDQKDYLYLIFEKAPMYLTVNGYRANPKGPMTIFLTNWGNVDVRQL